MYSIFTYNGYSGKVVENYNPEEEQRELFNVGNMF